MILVLLLAGAAFAVCALTVVILLTRSAGALDFDEHTAQALRTVGDDWPLWEADQR